MLYNHLHLDHGCFFLRPQRGLVSRCRQKPSSSSVTCCMNSFLRLQLLALAHISRTSAWNSSAILQMPVLSLNSMVCRSMGLLIAWQYPGAPSRASSTGSRKGKISLWDFSLLRMVRSQSNLLSYSARPLLEGSVFNSLTNSCSSSAFWVGVYSISPQGMGGFPWTTAAFWDFFLDNRLGAYLPACFSDEQEGGFSFTSCLTYACFSRRSSSFTTSTGTSTFSGTFRNPSSKLTSTQSFSTFSCPSCAGWASSSLPDQFLLASYSRLLEGESGFECSCRAWQLGLATLAILRDFRSLDGLLKMCLRVEPSGRPLFRSMKVRESSRSAIELPTFRKQPVTGRSVNFFGRQCWMKILWASVRAKLGLSAVSAAIREGVS